MAHTQEKLWDNRLIEYNIFLTNPREIYIYIFKELKETISKELKESMRTTFHQIENIKKLFLPWKQTHTFQTYNEYSQKFTEEISSKISKLSYSSDSLDILWWHWESLKVLNKQTKYEILVIVHGYVKR